MNYVQEHFMKALFILFSVLFLFQSNAQLTGLTHTAGNSTYMKPEEREMIDEINRLRSNPASYLVYIESLLKEQENIEKNFGKGSREYSLSYRTEKRGNDQAVSIDTNWYYSNEEKLNALRTLVDELKKTKPLRVLKPDPGIYKAARQHALDQEAHQWTLLHTGSDGSEPSDRIKKFVPSIMATGENIAGTYPKPTPREVVIQLLVDDGIPGYGHRQNLLSPIWTHIACFTDGLHDGMYRWIQDFGEKN